MEHPFEKLASFHKLYESLYAPICEKYMLTSMEFHILMFLHNNPQYHTAADIVKIRNLTKSHVSMAVKSLMSKGLLLGSVNTADRRTVCLQISDAALSLVEDGRQIQALMINALFSGFSSLEQDQLRDFINRIQDNIEKYANSMKLG